MAQKVNKTAKALKSTEAKTTEKTTNKKAVAEVKKEQPKDKATKKASEKADKSATAKQTKATVKPAAKAEAKKLSPAKEMEPTTVAAKTTESKPVVVKKAEPKQAMKKAAAKTKKAESKAVQEEPVTKQKEEVKPAKKAAVKKKAAPKKQAEPKPAKKAPVKVDEAKMQHYASLSIEECIALMQSMNVQYEYEDYYRLLSDEADVKKLEKDIIDGNDIKKQKFTFEKNGCDEDLVLVTLNKIGDTMDIKASDYKDFKKAVNKALKFSVSEDGEANAAEYLDEFKLSEKLLMIGQRKGITTAAALSELIGADTAAYFHHFFDFAYELLPSWQYNDVKFYEDFAYAILSQFSDLYAEEQLRIQIDVADLYIKHGDYQHGDEMYGYILRDNQIKDYIYYRYASVYKAIDYNKAKAIAYSSLQCVDDRYTYYANIMEIIND